MPIDDEEKLQTQWQVGTLAIDLGNWTTVVAFQGEADLSATLLDLPPITRLKGEIPSLIWQSETEPNEVLVGNQVLQLGLAMKNSPNLSMDFKRWIGNPDQSKINTFNVSPEQAGELLLCKIWEYIPHNLKIKRLVLTAPVDTYRRYRAWLQKVCQEMKVEEIALVDEPTAAAMGAGVPPGAKLLVIDIGGSTIDLSLVALEGGEGKAEPIAQLIRFGGEDLEGKSKQILRCAKVLGKAGLSLGGRDLDRWIVNSLHPEESINEMLLNTAEKLKCRLSQDNLSENEYLVEKISSEIEQNPLELRLNKMQFEEILIKRGFLSSLENLLEKTLAGARANKCSLGDLNGVVVVGGGTRIPLFKKWVMKALSPIPVLTPPPIETVAVGALNLTPGVTIKDVLQKGVSLRCWDEARKEHLWHPLFLPGQTWPTQKGLEIILAATKNNQLEIELLIGEPSLEGSQEIIYINGVPVIKESSTETKVIPWSELPIHIELNPPGNAGEDCVKLNFTIDNDSHLIMQGVDIRSKEIIQKRYLGSIR